MALVGTKLSQFPVAPSNLPAGGTLVGVDPAGPTDYNYSQAQIQGGLVSSGLVRDSVTNGRTYYVRTDGSDSNNGLTNSSAGAFATITHAFSVISSTLDVRSTIAVQVAAGTYNENVFIFPWVGNQNIILQGDTSTPSNVLINALPGNAAITIEGTNAGPLTIQGFKITSAGGGIITGTSDGWQIGITDIEFGACVYGVWLPTPAYFQATGNITISGGGQSLINVESSGTTFWSDATFTWTADVTYSVATVTAISNSLIELNGAVFDTNGHTVTGQRYIAYLSSAIRHAFNPLGPFYIPGTIPGVSYWGGVYEGVPAIDTKDVLTAGRTYYFRSDGSNDLNSRTGLTNSAGDAFQTVQFLYDNVISKLDFNGYAVEMINGNAAALTTGLTIGQNWEGGGILTFDNGGTTLTVTGGDCLAISLGVQLSGSFIYQNVTLSTISSGKCINHQGGGLVENGAGVVFGACAEYHIYATGSGPYVLQLSNYTISGAAGAHAVADGTSANIRLNAATITITGTPNFATAFVWALRGGLIYSSSTYSGSATGVKGLAELAGGVENFGLNNLPGNSAVVATSPGWAE